MRASVGAACACMPLPTHASRCPDPAHPPALAVPTLALPTLAVPTRRYAGRDILTHEFAHLLMDYGLPPALREEIRATYKRVTETTRRWRRADGELAYAGSNASEYWAELSMWYFGSHGEYVDRQARVPPPGCHALAEYDPDGFRLLGRIYGGTHPLLRSDALAPVARLAPVAAAAVSGGGEEESELPLVTLHFANLRGEADAELWCADARPPSPSRHPWHRHTRGNLCGVAHGTRSAHAPPRALQVGRPAGRGAPLRLRRRGGARVAADLRDARVGGAAHRGARQARALQGGRHRGQLRRGGRLLRHVRCTVEGTERPGRLVRPFAPARPTRRHFEEVRQRAPVERATTLDAMPRDASHRLATAGPLRARGTGTSRVSPVCVTRWATRFAHAV